MTTTLPAPIPSIGSTNRSPLVRAGVPALLLGGPLGLVFHVLYGLGHGPTVVNEHGVVLGLTNDQWSYVGASSDALVLMGVLAVATLHTGRVARTATWLLAVGLVVSSAAAWVFPLFSLGALLEFAGMACLAVAVLREGVLPRWSGPAFGLPVVTFLPVLVAPAAVISAEWHLGGLLLQSEDILAATVAAAWTTLGLALARATR